MTGMIPKHSRSTSDHPAPIHDRRAHSAEYNLYDIITSVKHGWHNEKLKCDHFPVTQRQIFAVKHAEEIP